MDGLDSFLFTSLELAIMAADHNTKRYNSPRYVVYSPVLGLYMVTGYGAPAIDGDGIEIVYTTEGTNDDA